MALDFKEIVLSWYDSLTSEDKKRPGQLELAQKRYSMCLGCEHFRPKRFLKNDSYCNDCGCPIKGKIYSRKFDACPKHTWIEIEEEFENILDKPKKSKSIL
jgi:ribosomal protein L37AE/L43A